MFNPFHQFDIPIDGKHSICCIIKETPGKSNFATTKDKVAAKEEQMHRCTELATLVLEPTFNLSHQQQTEMNIHSQMIKHITIVFSAHMSS